MILFVEDVLVQSLQELHGQFRRRPTDQPVRLIVLRSEELIAVELAPRVEAKKSNQEL